MNQNEKDQLIKSLQTKIRELEQKLEEYSQGGIKILFSGKANAQRVARKVKPRTLREIPELSLGSEEQKSQNLVIEGDNLLAMATLYQYHGKIDLIIADPPYNTGKDFRYNDLYAKNLEKAETSLMPRTEKYLKQFKNPDKDRRGTWVVGDPSSQTPTYNMVYALQNPFTGEIHYPPRGCWTFPKSRMKSFSMKNIESPLNDPAIQASSQKAYQILEKGKEDYENPIELGVSGTTAAASSEIARSVGSGHVLDPFGGSGTTGHAVLQLNKETADQKEHEPLGGGFKFTTLDKQINNQAILQMERNELIDTIIASRIDKYQQKYQNLQILKSENYRYLIAKDSNQEGFFLIWDGPNQNVNFTKGVYQKVVQEATENNLKPPYHVYARLYLCQVDTKAPRLPMRRPEHIKLNTTFLALDLRKWKNMLVKILSKNNIKRQVEPKQTLSITIPISLYQKLQQEIGKGKISKFIKNLVEKELSEEEEKLAQAYKKCYANNPQLLEEAKL
ncbi:12066_t:CDS:2 [Funneliformis geosporum]|uniref:12066_t:CDS:1 n=1 Tax=Funneliformis geosporum TaxID=1117311 RepID=A0A9W4SLQ3_9GLOM|nr:12066_t:CDS:2 [Funneliformis geosporum]